jgi:hypothetical protein
VRKEFGRPPDVVLANAGVIEKHNLIPDQDADAWWASMVRSINAMSGLGARRIDMNARR